MKKIFFWACITALLSSCSHNPSNYFKDYYESEELEEWEYIPSFTGNYIKVLETSSINKIQDDYKKDGYVVIGTASFNKRWGSRYNLVKQAREVGAEIVIVTSTNTSSQIYIHNIPYIQDHTMRYQGTSNTIGNTYGSVYSNGRNIADYSARTSSFTNYSGSITYQTTETMLVPTELRIYDQKAIFMAKKTSEE